jgi:hypoxanthine phosphoribosyltransferase
VSLAGTGSSLAEALEARRAAREVASAAEVAAALDRMAAEVAVRLAAHNPVVLAVMQGGVFTAVELCRRLDCPYEFDFVHATRYGDRLTGAKLEWRVRPRVELRDRVVLLVDDVLDQGVTLDVLQSELGRVGVSSLYSAVLVSKEMQPPVERPQVDFVGLSSKDIYLFGCGMDYKGYWRGLTALYGLES